MQQYLPLRYCKYYLFTIFSLRLPRVRPRHNTRWTAEEDGQLKALVADGLSLPAIAKTMARSYQAIEKRAFKLKWPLLARPSRAPTASMSKAETPDVSLLCAKISVSAMPVVEILYRSAMKYRSMTVAKNNAYVTLRPRLERVIGAIVRELLIAPRSENAREWIRISVKKARSSKIGVNTDILSNLIDALEVSGFVERRNAFESLVVLMARASRPTRIRATPKLIALCTLHEISAQNAHFHFAPA
jgi:hypothetical protein